jgi:hypothetical protein
VVTEVVRELSGPEERSTWARFYTQFHFRPSSRSFPGIAEPATSVTWSLDELHDDPNYRKLDRLVDLIHEGLARSAPLDQDLLFLDWQHTCYRIRPRLASSVWNGPRWPELLSPYPDGDYYIYLAEDLRFGTFGHLWEHSLCVFGAELLDEVADGVTEVCRKVIRRGGTPVDHNARR